ncbi:hypothetical protein EDB85DRAFT_2293282 [Lactarius pseudohatsudake]|nr:hypothetical protein EDB85DRAFT_2293282 [Lactarius pseudohatsudake]
MHMRCRRGRSVPYSLTYKRSEHRLPTQIHKHMDTGVHQPPTHGRDGRRGPLSVIWQLHEDHTGQYDATRGTPGFGLKKVTGLKDASERPFPHAHGERRAPNPRVSVSASTSATAPTSASAVPAWPRSSKGSGRRMEIGVGAVTPPAAGCDRVLVAATTRALRAE